MTKDEILSGESKNVEFKLKPSDDKIKFLKSIVAFANGIGGKIIFGIEDKTHKIVGFERDRPKSEKEIMPSSERDSEESIQKTVVKTVVKNEDKGINS